MSLVGLRSVSHRTVFFCLHPNIWYMNLLSYNKVKSCFQVFLNQLNLLFLNSMKWNGTEFLYHPELLQVQIITKKLKTNIPKTSKVATLKTRRGKNKKGSLQGFKTQEVTKSWNDQRRRTSAQPKHRKEASLCPSVFWITDLKPEVCAYSTALTKHTSQRCS